jgi:flotillin
VFDVAIFAQGEGLPPWAVPAVITFAAVAALMFVCLALILKQYRRCPPNRIMVIYGAAGPEAATCVHGGARLIIPLLQDYGWLSLEPIRIEVSRQRTSSGKTISDPLPRVFSVAIGTEPELMQAAAERLLGLAEGEIKHHAEDVIVAQLDRLLDAIESGELQAGSDAYYERLESSLGAELAPLGLVLINFRRE